MNTKQCQLQVLLFKLIRYINHSHNMRGTFSHISSKTKRHPNLLTALSMTIALVLMTASTFVAYDQYTAHAQNSSSHLTAANFTTADNSSSSSVNTAANANSMNKTVNVTVNGKNYPVKYSINNGQVFSIVADKAGTKLVVTIQPTKNGKLTVDLPRNLIDYKLAGNKDGNFVVHINGKQNVPVNVKQIASSPTSRTLSIDFGSGDRVIEIIGTQMA